MNDPAKGLLGAAPFVGSEFPEEEFGRLRTILLEKRGFDLARYKDNCVKRRIAARIRSCGFSEAGPYIELLRREEAEIDLLLASVTIHVSQFFRNPSTFHALKDSVLPGMVRQALGEGSRKLRFWSVGCAGGEEVYSLAFLLEGIPPEIQVSILGTDISHSVLQRAREGRFESLRLSNVPQEIIERFFQKDGGRLRIENRIREKVHFRHHDVLSDAEFPAADLILCRNVLIYFSRKDQKKILERFSRSMLPGGRLVLGKAEILTGSARNLFEAEDPAERIYRLKERAG